MIPRPVSSLMPVTVVRTAPCSSTAMLPLVVFVALKLPTVFALVSVVPVAETVVNNPVVLNVPVSVIAAVLLIVMAPPNPCSPRRSPPRCSPSRRSSPCWLPMVSAARAGHRPRRPSARPESSPSG